MGKTCDIKGSLKNIPEPITHHKITCKKCNKKVKVDIKYTRLCGKCRWDWLKRNSDSSYWQTWNAIY